MPFSASPYIDGNTVAQNRAIWLDSGMHYAGVYPHLDLLDTNGRLKTAPDRFSRFLYSAPVTTAITEAIRWDTTNVRLMFVRIENSNGGAINDFYIDGCAHIETTGGFWETICDADSYFTTGTGENQGNTMVLVRKCSSVNPRSLAINSSTWLALNCEYYGGIRFRAKAAANTTLTIRANLTNL